MNKTISTLGLFIASTFFPALVAANDKTVLCFVAHKTSHGFGKHEYAAGCHLMGDWLEEVYPGKIESRYSVNWPEDEDKFFKGADAVIFLHRRWTPPSSATKRNSTNS